MIKGYMSVTIQKSNGDERFGWIDPALSLTHMEPRRDLVSPVFELESTAAHHLDMEIKMRLGEFEWLNDSLAWATKPRTMPNGYKWYYAIDVYVDDEPRKIVHEKYD